MEVADRVDKAQIADKPERTEDIDRIDETQIANKSQKTKDANGVDNPGTDSQQATKYADGVDKAQIADVDKASHGSCRQSR